MPITLSALEIDRGDAWVSLSAVEMLAGIPTWLGVNATTVKWLPLINTSSSGYVIHPLADAFSATLASNGTVYTINAPSAVTSLADFVSLSGITDTETIQYVVSSCDVAGVSAGVDFYPLRLDVLDSNITTTSVMTSAVMVDSRGGMYRVRSDTDILWSIQPGGSVSGFNIKTSGYYNHTTQSSDDYDTIVWTSSATDYTLYGITLSAPEAYRSPDFYSFAANPTTQYLLTQTTNTAIASAFTAAVDPQPIVGSTGIKWRVTPSTGLGGSVTGPGGSFALNGDGWTNDSTVTNLGWIQLTTTDYTQNYTIHVSAANSVEGGYEGTHFIPYKELILGTSTLSAQAIQTVFSDRSKQYMVSVYGNTGGVFHNLSPSTYVAFNQLTGVQSQITCNTLSPTGSQYFLYNTQPIFSDNRSTSPLYITFNTTEWSGTGTPSSDTAGFMISAVVDNGTAYTAYAVDDFTLQSMQWIPDSYWLPDFRLNYEASTVNDAYRVVTNPYNLWLRDSSTVPPASSIVSSNYSFGFSNGSVAVTGVSFNAVLCAMQVLSQSVSSVTLSAQIQGSGWPEASLKITDTKTVHFVTSIPSASSFFVYPSSAWNGSSFFSVTNPITLSPGASSFGYGHTEVYNLSAPSYSGATYYWSVSGITPQPVTNTNNVITVNIPSTCTETKTLPVSVQIVNSVLPYNMPSVYANDTTGVLTRYANFGTSDVTSDTRLQNSIYIKSISDLVSAAFISIDNTLAIPTDTLHLSGNAYITENTPVIPTNTGSTYTWTVSTNIWQDVAYTTTPVFRAELTTSQSGEVQTIYPFEHNIIDVVVSPSIKSVGKISALSGGVGDWCSQGISIASKTIQITASPVEPLIYTSNLYVVTGSNVLYQNLTPKTVSVSCFDWELDDVVYRTTNSGVYTTSYNSVGYKDITITTYVSSNGIERSYSNTIDNIVNVLPYFTTFDENVFRVYGGAEIILPNNSESCTIAPNDWVTAGTLNTTIDKIVENMDYLVNASKLYDQPPTKYVGWLGALNVNAFPKTHWRADIDGINTGFNDVRDAVVSRIDSVRDVITVSIPGIGDSILLTANSTSVNILSSDIFGTPISSVSERGLDDLFVDVVAVGIDSTYQSSFRVYTLDRIKNRVVVFSYDFATSVWNVIYSWGGFGGMNAKSKFNNPTDMLIDSEDRVWITDSNNLCVKRYSRTGSWQKTITSDYFTSTNKPLSVVCKNNTLYVACQSSMVTIDIETNHSYQYMFAETNNTTIKSLVECIDGGFVYLVCADKILKVTYDGVVAGVLGNDIGVTTYTNAYHDANRNLVISSDRAIVKYIDILDILNLRTSTETKMWPSSALKVQPGEYIQDWVYNRCFARIYDNLEVFRRSIIGKFAYRIDSTGSYIPQIRTFTPDERLTFAVNKSDVYVGINETVTYDVLYRCFKQLYDCQQVLCKLIKD